jgi:hypothetical protein
MTSYTDEIVMLEDWLKMWAADRQAVYMRGECGFGRPCVGINAGGHWVDLGPPEHIEGPGYSMDIPSVLPGARPPDGVDDAYHKHDCLAVLVHAADYEAITEAEYEPAIRQLFIWMQEIDRHHYVIKSQARNNDTALEAILHGTSVYFLAEREP